MSLNVSGHNISDIYVGNNKIDSIFVGEDLVYTAEKPFYDYFGFQIDDPTQTASVGFEQFVTDGADASKFSSYTIPTLYYSYDRNTWSAYTLGTGINIGSEYSYDAVYFKGDNLNTWYASYTDSETSNTYFTYLKGMFTGDNVSAIGNIMALRYSTPTPSDSIPCLSAFRELFKGCTSLTTAPELPATTLADYCYSSMFLNCTSLTTAPELFATTLTNYCYYYMFRGCTSLTTAPELPATTLTNYCYYGMFNGCTSLTTAPELPATTLASYCYSTMFFRCTSLTTAPELPATTLASYCYGSMFRDCTSLTTAPELPATTLANNCYASLFNGCTSLTTAPELPATTLTSSCYVSMFSGCSSLTEIPYLPATTLADACYQNMFASLASPYGGIKASSSSSSPCIYPCMIPPTGSGSAGSKSMMSMFINSAGDGNYTPSINTTFYTEVPMASQ